VKAVDVAAPGDVIGEIVVDTPDDIEPPLVVIDLSSAGTTFLLTEAPFPASSAGNSFTVAVSRARTDLAARIGASTGAAVLVTAEAAPDAPGGGWLLVFRLGDQQYLYRASDAGYVEFVESDFEFAGGAASAWHAVEFAIAPPAGIPGDANLDGRVDQLDHAAWKAGFGTISITTFHAADGNGDGVVNAADYTTWRDNLGAVDPNRQSLTTIAGDYNGDGAVDHGDYAFWKANFAATSGAGLAADGNGNGIVDAADYSVWRDHMTTAGSGAASAALTIAPEDSARGDASFAFAAEENDVAPAPAAAVTAEMADAVLARPERLVLPNEFVTSPQIRGRGPAAGSRFATRSVDAAPLRDSLLLLARNRLRANQADGRGDSDAGPIGRDDRPDAETAIDAALAAQWGRPDRFIY
jgi:hypothetical protein